MAKKADTMTIRVDSKILAALDMIAAKRRITQGKSETLGETIWFLIGEVDKDVARTVDKLSKDTEAAAKDKSDE